MTTPSSIAVSPSQARTTPTPVLDEKPLEVRDPPVLRSEPPSAGLLANAANFRWTTSTVSTTSTTSADQAPDAVQSRVMTARIEAHQNFMEKFKAAYPSSVSREDACLRYSSYLAPFLRAGESPPDCLLRIPFSWEQPKRWWNPALAVSVVIYDCTLIAMALENGADINARLEASFCSLPRVAMFLGLTPLLLAVRTENSIETIDLLLSKGALPDIPAPDGTTALFVAAGNLNTQITSRLIDCGANVQWQDMKGATALHFAVKGGIHNEVRLLLLHGANIDHADRRKRTPLIHAAKTRSRSLVELLLANGARVTAVDENGHSAAWYAYQRGAFLTSALLLTRGAQIDCAGMTGYRLLEACIKENELEALPMLLQQGADISFEDEVGRNGLDVAVAYNRPKATQFLLQHGSYINHASRAEGWTPCFIAMRMDFRSVFDELMVSPELDLNHTDHWGRTALHIAAALYRRYSVMRLLNKGANPELADHNGSTPLIKACANGYWDIARALIAHGANPHHQNDAGLSPAALAASKGIQLMTILPVLGDHSDNPAHQTFRNAVPGLIGMLRNFSVVGNGADALAWQDWLAYQGVGPRTVDALALASSERAALLKAMTGQAHEVVRPALQSIACAGMLADLEAASNGKNDGTWAGALTLAAAGRHAEAGLRAALSTLDKTCAASADEDNEISPVALYYRLTGGHGMAGLLADAVSSAFCLSWLEKGKTADLAQAFAGKLLHTLNSAYFAGKLAQASAASGNPESYDKLMQRQRAMIISYCNETLAA